MFRARPRISAIAASAVLAAGMGAAGVALAAHPQSGTKYRGFTSEKALGFSAPVSFRVSGDGKSLLSFKYSSLGCFGGSDFSRGEDPFTKPFARRRVGSINVSRQGAFSIHGAESTYTIQGQTTVTTTTVAGRFTTARTASGTIRFTQLFMGPHLTINRCGPSKRTFTATAT